MSRDVLKQAIESSEAIDPIGVHHVFKKGMHGRKIDLEVFMNDPQRFHMLVAETVIYIEEKYCPLPNVLVSVANGTNELVKAVALGLGCEVSHALTEKTDKGVELTEAALAQIDVDEPAFALVLEDTATSGSSSGKVAYELLKLDIDRVEVLNVVQRTPELICLIGAGVVYKSVVVCYESIETHSPDDCQHCRDGWELIPYSKD